MIQPNLYDPRYVQHLFDEMANTYGLVNLISSLGFAKRWRRQCVELARITPGDRVYDLMSGQGETWPLVLKHLQAQGEIVAFDISPNMVKISRKTIAARASHQIHVSVQDALHSSLPDGQADALVCSFGLKTLSKAQLGILAAETCRLLKSGGRFACLEISLPGNPWLRLAYLFYIKYCIPLIGLIFLGNPNTYKLLAQYTQLFGNARQAQVAFRQAGLETEYQDFFFGCASAIYGFKQ